MFLKINEYTINTDQIRFIIHDQRGSITINFGSAGNLVLDADELALPVIEADAIRDP